MTIILHVDFQNHWEEDLVLDNVQDHLELVENRGKNVQTDTIQTFVVHLVLRVELMVLVHRASIPVRYNSKVSNVREEYRDIREDPSRDVENWKEQEHVQLFVPEVEEDFVVINLILF